MQIDNKPFYIDSLPNATDHFFLDLKTIHYDHFL